MLEILRRALRLRHRRHKHNALLAVQPFAVLLDCVADNNPRARGHLGGGVLAGPQMHPLALHLRLGDFDFKRRQVARRDQLLQLRPAHQRLEQRRQRLAVVPPRRRRHAEDSRPRGRVRVDDFRPLLRRRMMRLINKQPLRRRQPRPPHQRRHRRQHHRRAHRHQNRLLGRAQSGDLTNLFCANNTMRNAGLDQMLTGLEEDFLPMNGDDHALTGTRYRARHVRQAHRLAGTGRQLPHHSLRGAERMTEVFNPPALVGVQITHLSLSERNRQCRRHNHPPDNRAKLLHLSSFPPETRPLPAASHLL